MYLDERDNRPDEMQALRPNGFTEETVISDFPVRDKKTDPAHPPPQMAYTRGEKLHGWYKTVNRCTIREVKSARDAIRSREDNVLNYFITRSTNASAESLNSKMKAFRALLRGLSTLSIPSTACTPFAAVDGWTQKPKPCITCRNTEECPHVILAPAVDGQDVSRDTSTKRASPYTKPWAAATMSPAAATTTLQNSSLPTIRT